VKHQTEAKGVLIPLRVEFDTHATALTCGQDCAHQLYRGCSSYRRLHSISPGRCYRLGFDSRCRRLWCCLPTSRRCWIQPGGVPPSLHPVLNRDPTVPKTHLGGTVRALEFTAGVSCIESC